MTDLNTPIYDRAAAHGAVVGLIAADADGRAAFVDGAHRQRAAVSRQGHADAELVVRAGVGGFQVGGLYPGTRGVAEHVGRAGAKGG